jgi:anti-sigma factor RsiW
MNCQDMNCKLYLYADGEMAETEMRAVEAHLKECAACRALSAALEQENELLSAATSEAPWDSKRLDRLEKRLLKKTESRRTSMWQESFELLAYAFRLGMLILLLSLFMAAIHFNSGAIYELVGAPSIAAANKSAISAQIFVSGLMLLSVIFRFCRFQLLSKKSI